MGEVGDMARSLPVPDRLGARAVIADREGGRASLTGAGAVRVD